MKLEYKYKQLLLCTVCATLVYISLTNLESILAYAGTVYTVLKPFIYGAVMAFVINVPMRKVEGMLSKAGLKKSKRILAYLIWPPSWNGLSTPFPPCWNKTGKTWAFCSATWNLHRSTGTNGLQKSAKVFRILPFH